MKKDNFKKWMFYFSIVATAIILEKVLQNFTNITNWIVQLISILAPFVGGILIAYILYIPCKKVENAYKNTNKKRFINKYARGLSVATVYIMTFIILFILFNCILPILFQSFSDLISNIPGYYEEAVIKINELPEDHFLRGEQVTEVVNRMKSIDLQSFLNPEKIMGYVKSVISAVSSVFNAFVAIVVSIYILLQRKGIIKFWSRLFRCVFKEETCTKLGKYFRNGNEIFFKFLTSQMIDALIVGIVVSIAMLILNVKYAVLLGFLIGLFNLIPFFGAIIAVGIAIIVTLLTDGIGKAIAMAIVVIILQQIDANIINPKIVGNSLEISQLLVIFAVTIGGAYFGVLGMFLAVPVMTVIKMVIEDSMEEKEKCSNCIDNNNQISL